MGCFPFFIELTGVAGLLVGGGHVALRKAEKLLPYGPALTVVAPQVCPELAALPVTICSRGFDDTDLDDTDSRPAPGFVIAATSDRALNHHIASLCRARRIPVNVVDDPAACSFLFPALVQRGRLSVGISTGGASPTAAIWLKERIEALLPPHFAALLEKLEALRPALKAACPDPGIRARRFRALFREGLAHPDRLDTLCAGPTDTPAGQVWLIGAGCGQADLITVRGLQRLENCEAVVYDDLIDAALLEKVPAGAQRYHVGKRSGHHSMPQREIEALLIRLARQGLRVARLKGGDPYIFGRGGEEAQALQSAGIPFEVIPGISSAVAIPAEAGIPVTQRGMSRAVHIITAHTGGPEAPDYRAYAGWDGTLVFLMGVQRLPRIAADLIAGGRSPATPAAVVRGGNVPACAVRSDLAHIAEDAAAVPAPAVIVVGDVAALDLRSLAVDPSAGVR